MTTLQQIVITATQNPRFQTTITLGSMGDLKYIVIVKTNHMGVVNEFEQICETYKEALREYIDYVKDYAEHTLLINL